MKVTNNKNQSGGCLGDDLIKRQIQSGGSLRIRLRKEKPKRAAWLQAEQEYHCFGGLRGGGGDACRAAGLKQQRLSVAGDGAAAAAVPGGSRRWW